MALPTYEVYALRYAHRVGKRGQILLGGDPHDGPLGMDYFVWLIRDRDRVVVVDLGFTPQVNIRRKRDYLRTPRAGLALLGVDTAQVEDVIVTHLHYDHAGGFEDFPRARFHLQDDEMSYATGRNMTVARLRRGFEVEDVVGMVRLVYGNRVVFHDGDEELADGLSLHRIGGHTHGLQCVRVHTRRGWVVIASDAAHYYEQIEKESFVQGTFNLGEAAQGYRKIRRLAASADHIIPGHDPQVMYRYPPAGAALEGIAVRLDADRLE